MDCHRGKPSLVGSRSEYVYAVRQKACQYWQGRAMSAWCYCAPLPGGSPWSHSQWTASDLQGSMDETQTLSKETYTTSKAAVTFSVPSYSPTVRPKRVIKRGAVLTDIIHWANLKWKTEHECVITEVIHSRPLSQDPSDITHNAFIAITKKVSGPGPHTGTQFFSFSICRRESVERERERKTLIIKHLFMLNFWTAHILSKVLKVTTALCLWADSSTSLCSSFLYLQQRVTQ